MPPVTRAAAKSRSGSAQASKKVTPKPKLSHTAHKVTKSAHGRKKVGLATAMAAGRLAPAPEPATTPEEGVFELSPNRMVMDWYSLGGEQDDADWANILKEVRQHQGCLFAGRSTPGSVVGSPPGVQWIFIEWKSPDSRAQFLTSSTSVRLTQAVQGHSLTIVQLLGGIRDGVIKGANPIWGPALYEIWTVFLPLHLSSATIQAIQGPEMRGPINFNQLTPDTEMEDGANPCGGYLGNCHGWAYSDDGVRDDVNAVRVDVEYAGQRARRLVYFFHWRDEEAQAQYKREMCWTSRDRTMVGCNAMEVFLHDLEQVGMLGYETQQGRILEVTKY